MPFRSERLRFLSVYLGPFVGCQESLATLFKLARVVKQFANALDPSTQDRIAVS